MVVMLDTRCLIQTRHLIQPSVGVFAAVHCPLRILHWPDSVIKLAMVLPLAQVEQHSVALTQQRQIHV